MARADGRTGAVDERDQPAVRERLHVERPVPVALEGLLLLDVIIPGHATHS